MSEVEFDRLLDAVRAAIARTDQPALPGAAPAPNEPPPAMNDNEIAWPLIPFPDGWYSAC